MNNPENESWTTNCRSCGCEIEGPCQYCNKNGEGWETKLTELLEKGYGFYGARFDITDHKIQDDGSILLYFKEDGVEDYINFDMLEAK